MILDEKYKDQCLALLREVYTIIDTHDESKLDPSEEFVIVMSLELAISHLEKYKSSILEESIANPQEPQIKENDNV